jgi:hypothetical protein
MCNASENSVRRMSALHNFRPRSILVCIFILREKGLPVDRLAQPCAIEFT